MTAAINRPLNDLERELLYKLAIRCVAAEAGISAESAKAALIQAATEGALVLRGDQYNADIVAYGNTIIHTERDWLAFHAHHEGGDPWADRTVLPKDNAG